VESANQESFQENIMSRSKIWIGLISLPLFHSSWWIKASAADSFGAIAFSKEDGSFGSSRNFGTRAAAEDVAVQSCGNECEVVVWFVNGCGALAVGDDDGYGVGSAPSQQQAEQIALSSCSENYANCSIQHSICTAR
jgi:Domain of unknown function (DUF4189)